MSQHISLLVVKALLNSSRLLSRCSSTLTIVAIAITLMPLFYLKVFPLVFFISLFMLVLGCIEKYYAYRLVLDNYLLESCSDAQSESIFAQIDQGLITLGWITKEKKGRTLAERWFGIKKLLISQGIILVSQLLCLFVLMGYAVLIVCSLNLLT